VFDGDATYKSVDRQVAGRNCALLVEGDLQRTVGKNLRAYRMRRGLSQEAFADVIGVHRTYMGGVERGERNLTLKSVERIAEKIDVDALELLRPIDPTSTT
jgi:DNA-binding XRE family transcriptional regulator